MNVVIRLSPRFCIGNVATFETDLPITNDYKVKWWCLVFPVFKVILKNHNFSVMEDLICRELINQSIKRMNQSTDKITACMKQLDEKDVGLSPNEHLNSVGNLILHLCGNIRQHIISALSGAKDIRERDLEFSTRSGFSKAELTKKLHDTAAKAVDVIKNLKCEDLLKKRMAQGVSHTGVDSIVHVTEHYSYHTGQIILLTKLSRNIDMGFYAGVDLNKRNEPTPDPEAPTISLGAVSDNK
jgi:uncharacterized damage-inducible protein DinB